MIKNAKHLYEFDPFRIDATERVLLCHDRPVTLTPKAFDTLLVLVQSSGRVLPKDELMEKVWPDTIVEENNLTQNISLLRKIFGDDLEEAHYIETVPRRGYRFVARVNERWQDAEEAASDNEHADHGPADEQPTGDQTADRLTASAEVEASHRVQAPDVRRRHVWMVVGVAALVVAALGLIAYQRVRNESRERSAVRAARDSTAIEPRRSVAVLGFKNLSGRHETEWVSTALSEMLTTELAAGEKLRTVPGESVALMKLELRLPNADSFGKKTLARIHKNAGADFVVLGSYTYLGREASEQIRVDIRLQDAVGGDTIAAVAETGTESDLFGLVSRAGARLRGQLGVGEVTSVEANGVRASLPASADAARLYSEGLAKLRIFDALSARDLLEKAVTAEPQNPLAHSALASAWSALGYDPKAKAEAKRAFDLSSNLSRAGRLWVEGRYRETTHEWDKAIEVYRTLFDFFPDNLEYGLRLAEAQTSGSKEKEALGTLELLRKLRSQGPGDARIDLAEARVALNLSDFQRAQAAAARAKAKGEEQGARLLMAQAMLAESRACYDLGEWDREISSASQARQIFASVGDGKGVADALTQLGNAFWKKGDVAAYKKAEAESLAIRRKIGDERGVALMLNNIAVGLNDQGDVAGGLKLYRQALVTARKIDDKQSVALYLDNVASSLIELGDLDAAQPILEQAQALEREIGERNELARTTNSLATVLWEKGNWTAATKMYQEALGIQQEVGDKSSASWSMANLGEAFLFQGELPTAKSWYELSARLSGEIGDKASLAFALFVAGEALSQQGDLRAAREEYEKALALREELGEEVPIAEDRVALAEVSIEEGSPRDAETPAREAAGEFRGRRMHDDEANAEAVLARSLMVQGRRAEAQQAIERALALSKNSQSRLTRLGVAIVAARVRASSGGQQDRSEAMKSLASILAEAKKFGLLSFELEARLALGEIEMKAGNATTGRADLEALAKDAAARGFGLIARKATDAAR